MPVEDALVLKRRQGQVLSQNTLLKVDYYFDRTMLKGINTIGSVMENEDIISEQSKSEALGDISIVRMSGAQNFRGASNNSRIFGVAQPTLSGIRTVLNYLEARDNEIAWINLREEPLVYINYRPFVLREKERPFQNLPYYSGISLDRLEDMEDRLKHEILVEARNYKHNILIHEEITPSITADEGRGLVSGYWESISPVTVQTPKEIFADLEKEGYKVKYCRIPLTAEQDLVLSDYDRILANLRAAGPQSKLVFNCQLGKTRSTHAMIVAWIDDLLSDSQNTSKALALASERSDSFFKKSKDVQYCYDSGDYKPVQELVRILKFGVQSKELVDLAIDSCDLIRNLREVIGLYKTKADKSRSKESREMYLNAAFRNLSRYYHLISVGDYLRSVKLTSHPQSYSEFLSERPEHINIINAYDAELALSKPKAVDDLQVAVNRSGKILSRYTILKGDHFFKPLQEFNGLRINGAPNFRSIEVSDVRIFGTATPDSDGFLNILESVKAKTHTIRVINLREEAVLYINGSPYNLRDIDHPFTNINLEGISAERLQEIENDLKKDCLDELTANQKVLLHDETVNAELVSFWNTCDTIFTTQELMEKLIGQGYNINYIRVPVTPLVAPEVRDIEDILVAVREAKKNSESLLVFDHFGLGRTYLGMVLSALYLHIDSGVSADIKEATPAYQMVSVLLRMLPDSRRLFAQVIHVLDICKLGVHSLDFREEIDKFVVKAKKARTVQVANLYKRKACQVLKKYLLVIAVAAYLYDQKSTNNYSIKFSAWLRERTEIEKLLHEVETNIEEVLKVDAENELVQTDKDIARNGEVLSKNTVLKNDHFPGCQRMHLLPRIEGAPNFRKIDKEQDYGKVYGVAIPTTIGIENILHYLKAKVNRIVWINLREEPIVYISNLPYTLREKDKPFSNIEQTGIVAERLVLMEQRLKQDIIAEAAQNEEMILVHDENEKLEAFNHYLAANSETVLRLDEVYTTMKQKGYLVDFHRVPITDEKAPEPIDFDYILKSVISTDVNTTFYVCNCQQGRGRTTTCIVIMCLVNAWRINAYSLDEDLKNDDDLIDTTSIDEVEKLRNGNYKVVQNLMRVLKYGKKNKKQVDTVLDDCSQMQNLRTTIYDTKVLAVPEPNIQPTKKQLIHYERAIGYLERYMYLIIFNEYLHEEMHESEPFLRTFDAWLSSRAEINNILSSEFNLD